MSAYDWGDPKNPEYVEWLLDQVDQRRKNFYQEQAEISHDTYGSKGQPKPRYDPYSGEYED